MKKHIIVEAYCDTCKKWFDVVDQDNVCCILCDTKIGPFDYVKFELKEAGGYEKN